MNHWVINLIVGVLTLVSYWRWVRVAQREHYEPGRIFAMISIWFRASPSARAGLIAIIAFSVIGFADPVFSLIAGLMWLTWPVGMSFTGGRSRLAITPRVKRLLAIVVVLHAAAVAAVTFADQSVLMPFVVVPLVLEVSLSIARPIENRLNDKYRVQAAAKIKRVAPRVVAITGSYGKTSTKNYATHLLQGRWSTLASPASFNNVMGLSRAVNDRLEPGTDVFVAEMGTYGPGEIAALCDIFAPEVSAITTIGEAHLERMKNRATIVKAKSEILVPARTIVLNVDVPELAAAAEQYAATKRVIRVSTQDETADVAVLGSAHNTRLVINGASHDVVLPDEVGHPINVAVAVGLALALDVPEKTILERIGSVPATPHRAETTRTAEGLTVIDDTYNSNPDGAAGALASAKAIAGESGSVFTITPGMVELGDQQFTRNADFARSATEGEKHFLCIVGQTNRKALRGGEADRTALFESREKAAEWVMRAAQPGDVVLYENDLPDHYP